MTAKKPGPPQVSIRAIREAYGLSIRDLIVRLEEQGVTVRSTGAIRNVEIGVRRPSPTLLTAWAKALKLNPVDINFLAAGDADEEDCEEVQAAA